MKRRTKPLKKSFIVLMLIAVTMMAPISASATFYDDRTAWEAAVASYMDVALPTTDLSIYQTLALPSGGGDVFNINAPLTYASDFYYTNTTANENYYANGTFYNMPNDWTFNLLPVSAFGFDMVPAANFAVAADDLTINLYTAQGGMLSQTVSLSTPEFFGWVGDDVTGFSTWASASYGLGNFVQGEGTASVPEPTTMLLLGLGLIGLAGLRRKIK